MQERAAVRTIEDHFAGLGAGYDADAFATAGQRWVSERELESVRGALFGIGPHRRVLDAGCGNGRISELLADELGHRVTAIDPVAAMLHTARARVGSLRPVQARLGDPLPFPDGSFDAVVAIRVLKWVPDWWNAVRELARVLAPGGRIVLEVTNRASLARFGYFGAPITLLTMADLDEVGRAADIDWYRTCAGSHLPHRLWQIARGPRAVQVASGMQRACDSVLGFRGARSYTMVGRRSPNPRTHPGPSPA